MTEPDVLFADEPTGALDIESGRVVLDSLRETVDRYGQTVLMVTHDPVAAARADGVVSLPTAGSPVRWTRRRQSWSPPASRS